MEKKLGVNIKMESKTMETTVNNCNSNNNVNGSDTSEFPAVEFDYIGFTDYPVIKFLRSVSRNKKQVRAQLRKNPKNLSRRKSEKKCNISREQTGMTVVKENQMKNIQPGECMKFIDLDFDEGLQKYNFYVELRTMLKNATIRTREMSLIIPNMLCWRRMIESYSVNSENEVKISVDKETEQQIVIVWNWDQVIEKIENHSFVEALHNITMILHGKKILLILYGMEEYFRYHRENLKTERLPVSYYNIDKSPKISRKDFERSLVDAQICLTCNCILIENSEDLCTMLLQCTKAIAESPYKMSLRKNEMEHINFYASGNNKNTIKVDTHGNGLKRLWSKQLCFFNNAGLATADALCTVYPSPLQLMNAYLNHPTEEGDKLLKDIPIRRAAASLSTIRKVGPELSRKIHLMFTSSNGDQLLS